MHECVICQHTGTCTWQILMNETHVCHVLYTDSNLYLFMAYVGFFVYSDTFLTKRKGDFIMDKLFAKRMDELVPSGIRKVNEKALAMERAGETVIHFELGRPDFDTPEYIKNACIEDIKKGDVFYTSNFGTMELREAIAWKLKTQNNVE